MFALYTQSSLDNFTDFDFHSGIHLCKEAIDPLIDEHQEFCDGEVWYRYYALDLRTFELWRYGADEWFKVGLPASMQIEEAA